MSNDEEILDLLKYAKYIGDDNKKLDYIRLAIAEDFDNIPLSVLYKLRMCAYSTCFGLDKKYDDKFHNILEEHKEALHQYELQLAYTNQFDNKEILSLVADINTDNYV